MCSFRIAGCQMKIVADKSANIATAGIAVKEAAQSGAQLVVLPEMFVCPYSNSEFPKYAEVFPGSVNSSLSQMALSSGCYVVGGSVPESDGSLLYNTCYVYDPSGALIAKHRKLHLFDIEVPGKIIFKESATLTAGSSLSMFKTDWCQVGVGVCYDMRFPELAQIYSQNGGVSLLITDDDASLDFANTTMSADCRLVVYPGAFNMTTGPAHWELLLRARALDNQIYTAAVSPARDPSAGYIAWGHSTICDPWGSVLATTDHQPSTIYADIDLARLEEIRSNIPVLRQKRNDIYRCACGTSDCP